MDDRILIERSALMCAGKGRYADWRTAERRAHNARKRGAKTVEAYRCRYCQWWHIGSSEHRNARYWRRKREYE